MITSGATLVVLYLVTLVVEELAKQENVQHI